MKMFGTKWAKSISSVRKKKNNSFSPQTAAHGSGTVSETYKIENY